MPDPAYTFRVVHAIEPCVGCSRPVKIPGHLREHFPDAPAACSDACARSVTLPDLDDSNQALVLICGGAA